MHITLIIPTSGRPAVVARLLSHLEHQTRLPDHVIVSATTADDIGTVRAYDFTLSCVYGAPGLCAQRNRGLSLCEARTDIVAFLDDDFVPADTYLAALERAFAQHSDYAVVTGNVLADGACGPGLSFDEALARLASHRRLFPSVPRVEDRAGAYGCNMSVRASLIRGLRFDERLPLYGWQEDTDFTSQLRSRGRIVCVEDLLGVHLGVKGGRVSGVRLGYSQVVNPVYLMGKGTMTPGYGLRLICRNLAANTTKSLKPEPYIDRRGRLMGNLIGCVHVLTRRADPEYILKL
ncbi:glycosyltransferase family 2 protein [Ancylobacter sp. A5.8]|uniref:glycosyltransferase family 2 protein n=1 Tax=Ancylobacter gelatini TaxID=2919920 RepID=UPI001F4E95C1|nr:glycosyltransferase family 2 protein [Ancylobacter gelatini]MCJ8145235.1 glycosyltransferase family 2 protein [Ancylobacter gelatini]